MFAVTQNAALAGGVRPTATRGTMKKMSSPIAASHHAVCATKNNNDASRSSTFRGASLRVRAGPSDNPNFDPNDPMTWSTPAGGQDDGDFMMDMGAPVEDLMQLDDAQLAQLLGAEGATVPVLLEDGGDDGSPAAAAAAAAAASGGSNEAAATAAFGALNTPAATAAEAIDKGLALYKSGEYREALAAFTAALDLPGTGPIRRRKAKIAAAGPSQGFADADVSLNEQIAIHYNCACCHARLEDTQAGLVSLVRAMEAGYDDYDNIRGDADIASLRADSRFEGIMSRFEPSGFVAGVFAAMQRGTTREQAKKGGAPKGGGGGELIGGLFNAVKDKMNK